MQRAGFLISLKSQNCCSDTISSLKTIEIQTKHCTSSIVSFTNYLPSDCSAVAFLLSFYSSQSSYILTFRTRRVDCTNDLHDKEMPKPALLTSFIPLHATINQLNFILLASLSTCYTTLYIANKG